MRDRASHTAPVKLLIIGLAAVPAVGSVLIGLFLWFAWAFPWENVDPHWVADRSTFSLLVGATAAAFLLAAVLVYAVARDRRWLPAVAFVLHASVALALLAWGLSLSDHGDDKIIIFAVACETPGLLAVILSHRLIDTR
jgi:hypothetical protein